MQPASHQVSSRQMRFRSCLFRRRELPCYGQQEQKHVRHVLHRDSPVTWLSRESIPRQAKSIISKQFTEIQCVKHARRIPMPQTAATVNTQCPGSKWVRREGEEEVPLSYSPESFHTLYQHPLCTRVYRQCIFKCRNAPSTT